MNRSLGTGSRLAMVAVMIGGTSLLGACTLGTTEAEDPALEQEAGPEGGEDIAGACALHECFGHPYGSPGTVPMRIGVDTMNRNRKSILLMASLCVAAAPILTACNGVGASELTPEELVDEGADEFSGPICNWTTSNADAITTGEEWDALSNGDSYGSPDCRRFVVEFTDYANGLTVGWDDQVVTEGECNNMKVIYSGYTYSGGSWSSKGTSRGHGLWDSGHCYVTNDPGSDELSFGFGTKYRIAAAAYERSCGPSGCYSDHKRVAVSSFSSPK